MPQPAQAQQHQPGRESQMQPKPDYEPRYAGSKRLQGKVALITGGDSGIGRATAVLFAREGAKIAFIYKDEEQDADETIRLIEREGAEGLKIRGNIGDKLFTKNAVGKVIDKFGQLDILINNAAEQHIQGELTDISEDQLQQTFQTNIFGIFYITQSALPYLKKGAAIINLTSITAYRGMEVLMDYASTKGAILAFTRSLSQNLMEKGIRVNAVAPGPVWTPLIPASFPADKVADFGSNSPMGRPGQPNEIAPAILFLACQDSSFISGQVIHPNGGTPVGG